MVINQVHIPTPAERARHLYPEWVANPTFLGPDGLSVFINEEGGIICRICQSMKEHLLALRTCSDLGTCTRTKKNLHRMEQIEAALSEDDQIGLVQHRHNQIRSVNFIAMHSLACTTFKPMTNLLNSVSNPHFVTTAPSSDNSLFWELASSIDSYMFQALTNAIEELTPISLSLDTSTEHTFTSMICVNVRFLLKSGEMKNLFLGLDELHDGASGNQLFQAFENILEKAGIDPLQIASISTDGDPAMVGQQKGFLAHIRRRPCKATIAETMEYGSIIASILKTESDQHCRDLADYFSDFQVQCRVRLTNHLLTQLHRTHSILQGSTLSFFLCKQTMESLRSELNTINASDLSQLILPHISEEFTNEKQEQVGSTTRFLQPDETTDFDFLNHQSLLAPDTETSDLIMNTVASKLAYFIKPQICRYTITHWRHLKTTYAAHYSDVGRSSAQIGDQDNIVHLCGN
ncbi:hypothetical protein BLNAU_16384 [Blattamonas nauphoetae]|uniref:DUF4371 domain-containing protein n=1 Tax=Blattamonas nauphoetae TaxID=2049346 RepID=A0ABQ9X8F3_9EUKA|nr:hypothetical protein BLNAU_16384 [Blattamonas nauphoetae]